MRNYLNKNILLGITSNIAAIKAVEIARLFIANGKKLSLERQNKLLLAKKLINFIFHNFYNSTL